MLWGYSPATDLLDAISQINPKVLQDGGTVNVLLVGCADPRHILMTMSKYYTHNVKVSIHFYVMELLIDLIARELLLMTLALEPSSRVPLSHKTHLWMEIFGNALIRPVTAEYILEKGEQLIHMVADGDYLAFRLPCVSINDLKYKERDNLEAIFRYWTKNDFNITTYWDNRLRKKLGTRYDTRNGVFEWDYFMKMKDKPGNLLVVSNEYNQWRKNGVAFVWLETEYCLSNPTFAMGVHVEGDQVKEFGYFGDMEIGPYFTFATACEDANMLTKAHHVNVKRGTDIFERNLSRCFFEIENGKPYVYEGADDRNLGQVVLKVNDIDLNPKPRLEADLSRTRETYSSFPVDHKITFLSTKSFETLPKKEKFTQFFDVVFVSQTMETNLQKADKAKEFFQTVKNGAPILWETRKMFLSLSKDSLKSYEDSVRKMMEESGCELLGGSDDFSNEFIVKFKKV